MDKKPLIGRKYIAVGIIFLFVGSSIVPAIAQDMEKPLPATRGHWLYVGGGGPGNYTSIQDAIDAAFDGDTIFVYDDSSPYYETIEITKSLYLIGENKDTTIINGGENNQQVIKVYASGITISGFTFLNSVIGIFGSINSSVISKNIFSNDQGGVVLLTSSDNNISENTIGLNVYYNEVGIVFTYNCHNNIISHNNVQRCFVGIGLQGGCKRNVISENTLSNNYYGVDLWFVFFNVIQKNNFMNNNKNANFVTSFFNRWTRNYWDDWSGIGPKRIVGLLTYPWDPWNDTKGIPFVNFDWHPAKEPYTTYH
jgi:parallel beta-helix repeat protein